MARRHAPDVGRRFRPRLTQLEDRRVPSTSIPLNTATWTALGPAPITNGQTNGRLACTGRVDGIAAVPGNADVVYVATAGGGVWKTTNATAANPSWTPLTDSQATLVTTGIAVAPSNPSTVYVATGDGEGTRASFGRGILRSTDGGASWTLFNDTGVFDRRIVNRIVVDPTNANTVYATVGGYYNDGFYGSLPTAAGVYKSTDGGGTWTNTTPTVAPNQPWSDIVMDPTTPTTLYAATSNLYSNYPGGQANGVYKTIDGGASWSLVGGGLPSGPAVGRISLALAAGSPNTVYMAYATATDLALAGVYRSTDAGATWANVTPTGTQSQVFGQPGAGQGNYDNVISVDPTDANVAYVGGSFLTAVIRTTDGGATWTTVGDNRGLTPAGPHADMHAMAYDATGRLLAGCDGGLFAYTRGTGTWVTLNGSAASGALNTIQSNEIALHPTNADVAFDANQDNGLVQFADGLGWTDRSNGGDGGAVAVDPNNPNNVYFVYTGNNVRRSTNGGASFAPANTGLPSAGVNFYPPLVIDPSNTSRVLFGATSVYASTNAASWSPLGTSPGIGTIDAIGVGASSGSTIYVSGTTSAGVFSVRVSTDNGATWGGVTPPGGTRQFVDFAVDPANSAVAYVVNNALSGAAVWRTDNSGASWTDITGTGLPDEQVLCVAFDREATGDKLFVGTATGVYVSSDFATASPTWRPFATGLPRAAVRDLEVAPALGVLAAGTYGRGMWEILIGRGVSAGGPYPVGEGASVGLTGSATDPYYPAASLTYAWDLDGDGVYGETGSAAANGNETGPTPTFTAANLDGPAMRTVGLRVSDPLGLIGTATATVVVNNVPPAATFTAANAYLPPGGTTAVSFANPSDPSPADAAAGFRYAFDFDNDGTFDAGDGTYAGSGTAATASVPAAYLTPGTHTIRGRIIDKDNGATDDTATVTVLSNVQSVQVADGSNQRSIIRSLAVTFSAPVTFPNGPAAAFQVARTGPGGPMGNVGLTPTVTTDAQGRTAVTLTFSGPLTEANTAAGANPSLIDGLYTLTVSGSQVAGPGGVSLDGDGDGAPGGDRVVNFHRLFGDRNGDRTVDPADIFPALQNAIFTTAGQPGFDPAFDFDGNGVIDPADLFPYLQQRLFTSI